jgi:hypothetical protein
MVSVPLRASRGNGGDRGLALLTTTGRALRLLFVGNRRCSCSTLSGQHFVAEAVGQIPVLLSKFAKAVLRHPVVPASYCQGLKMRYQEPWDREKGGVGRGEGMGVRAV